jgi:hypothetical protein
MTNGDLQDLFTRMVMYVTRRPCREQVPTVRACLLVLRSSRGHDNSVSHSLQQLAALQKM